MAQDAARPITPVVRLRLAQAYPNTYSSRLLRTVQRRLKVWRSELVRELVFGVSPHATPLLVCDALRHVKASRVTGQQVPSLREEAETAWEHPVEETA